MPRRRAMSAGAGFAQGFADTFTKRMEQRRAEQERIREEARAEERMAAHLHQQTMEQKKLLQFQGEQEMKNWQAKMEAEYGTGLGPGGMGPQVPLAMRKTQMAIEQQRQVGEIELDQRIRAAREIGDIQLADALELEKKKLALVPPPGSLGAWELASKRVEVLSKSYAMADERVKQIAANWADPKHPPNIPDLYHQALAEIEEAGNFKEFGISLIKPPTNELTEEVYLAAVAQAPDARTARDDVNRIASGHGAPPPSARVKDAFMNTWGVPLVPNTVGLFEVPGFAVGQTAGLAAGAAGMEPGAAETVQKFTQPIPGMSQGFETGYGAVGGAVSAAAGAASPTARFFANQISIEDWLNEIGAVMAEPTPTDTTGATGAR